MLTLVVAEAAKLRRSSALLLLAVGALLPAIANALYPGELEWGRYTLTSLLFLNLSSFITVTSLAGYLLSREYEKGTITVVLTHPVSRLALLLAKFLLLIPLIACMYLTSGLLTVVTGLLRSGTFPSAPGFWSRYVLMALGLGGMHLCLAPVALLAGILGRKTIVPVLVGLVYLLLYATFVLTETGSYLPPCTPTLFLQNAAGLNLYGVPYVFRPERSAAVFAGAFVVSSALAAVVFARKEQGGAA